MSETESAGMYPEILDRHVKEMPQLTPEEQAVVDLARHALATQPRSRGEWSASVPSSLPKLLAKPGRQSEASVIGSQQVAEASDTRQQE